MALIPDVAKKVLDRFWDFTVPVDLEGIAARAGFEVQYDTNMANVSGCCEVVNGKGLIVINANEPEVRRRFTLAHELAHLFLGHADNGKQFRDDPNTFANPYAFNIQEVDANRLGAEILMPSDAINHYIVSKGMTSILDLALAFKVSKVAMEIRLKNLGWKR